ncbi:MAG: hypothetical protein KFF77_08895 [Bacteroidetes bacterium]|nr:hypothetical protein [Bacteroidota bacterium]
MQLSSNRVLYTIARIFQIVVALVFLLAAFLKALDPRSFQEQIAMYGIFPELSGVAAWTLIIVEVGLATALIVNLFPRVVLPLMMALIAFFIGITWYGMSIGLGENCGCFGNLMHRGPEQVIIEDALMLVALLFSTVVLWTHRGKTYILRLAVTLGMAGVAALLTAVSPALPVDDLVTQLRPGAHFTAWPVDGLYGKDLNKDTHVVFLFTVESKTITADVQQMNAIAQREEVRSAVGLIVDGTEHLTRLMFEYAASFPVAAIEPRFARPFYRTLPRVFVLENGVVTHTWSELPAPAVVVESIQSTTP